MTGLRHRLMRLERGAATTPPAVATPGGFESAYDCLRLLEADLRERADSWTDDQRWVIAKLRAFGWSPATRFADLPDAEFDLLATLSLQRLRSTPRYG